MDTSAGISLRPSATLLCVLNGGNPAVLVRSKGHLEYRTPSTPPPPTPKQSGLSGLLRRLAGGRGSDEVDTSPFPFDQAGQILNDLLISTPPEAPHRVCIAVPAWANDSQRQKIADGARAAGWNVLGLANEPVAAAMASGLLGSGDGTVLVYDLSEDHFDVSVITIRGLEFEVLATDGLTELNTKLLPADFLAQTETPCQRALKYAGLDAAAIDAVVLAGASTREPQVVEFVTGLFGQPPLTRFDPEDIVGFGAAVRASMLV